MIHFNKTTHHKNDKKGEKSKENENYSHRKREKTPPNELVILMLKWPVLKLQLNHNWQLIWSKQQLIRCCGGER